MILIRMNEFDVVAALNEEQAIVHYERFTNKNRFDVVDSEFYGEVDPNTIVDFSMPWGPEEPEMTFAEAYKKGKFFLPHVFTNTLRI